jgi:MerR family mercuric resistance operon transcriptional regulator
MNIGRLAKVAEVPTTTVRDYEGAGLFAAPQRTGSGYRVYDGPSVEPLRFIRAAQGVGFSLNDVRELPALDSNRSRAARVPL